MREGDTPNFTATSLTRDARHAPQPVHMPYGQAALQGTENQSPSPSPPRLPISSETQLTTPSERRYQRQHTKEQHSPPIGAPSITTKLVQSATQINVFLRKCEVTRTSTTWCIACRSDELDERPSHRRTSTTCSINSNVRASTHACYKPPTRERDRLRAIDRQR